LRSPFENRDPGAESSEDLTEFECDVTPAQNDQMLRQLRQLEKAALIQPRNSLQPRDLRNPWPCTGVDIDPIGGDDLFAHSNLARTLEAAPLLDE
jgi:hypothetical protein